MTRIRYKQVGENTLVNSQPIMSAQEYFTVTVDLSGMRYSIVNQDGKKRASGSGQDRNETLLNVKKDLKELGVKFADEVRRRKARTKGKAHDPHGDDVLNDLLVRSVRDRSEISDGSGATGE